ncbi:RNA polymerase sigma factor [Thalassoglobus neptunius]|uniref:RNA polymerase sigma factor n=1 Tax=Thalassoglobus neptunius TaxID=1938619 RepID=A0A5C5VAL0_9PLAN|nr:sigma-70 family RNA polymerase sigma factor [Thalassoglobus neptunius]TWT35013.1 RNA polymerase sigma factor [Thalassoglobus neptunius]
MTGYDNSSQLQSLVHRASAGDPSASEELLDRTFQQLRKMTSRMLRNYPRLRRWEETDDVFQNAAFKLCRSLEEARPETVAGYFGLAATQIRRTLIDLVRHHFGPHGHGANHHSDGEAADDGRLKRLADTHGEPQTLDQWGEFHESVDQLPDDARNVFEMIWYGGLEQKDVAEVLKVSVPTIQRRWYLAQHLLHQQFGDKSPHNGHQSRP